MRIHKNSASYLITWCIGYNKQLDAYIKSNLGLFNYIIYVKISQNPLIWIKTQDPNCFNLTYNKNSALVLYKF